MHTALNCCYKNTFISVSKFLITTGSHETEIIDLSVTNDYQCFRWSDRPYNVRGAVGGLIDNTPLVCGGEFKDFEGKYHTLGECHSLSRQKSTLITNMSYKTKFAASIVLNGTTLWITGGIAGGFDGYIDDETLAFTEYITLQGADIGPEMPQPLSHHVILGLNSTFSMITGGRSFDYDLSGLTFFFDHGLQEWTNGPNMIEARFDHAAGIVTDKVSEEQIMVVTGGMGGVNYWLILSTTEVFFENQWFSGKN